MGYDEQWDRRVAREVAEIREDMDALTARINRVMLDFRDRRSELAEQTAAADATDEQVTAHVIEDPAWLKAYALQRRWERLNGSLERLHKDWSRQVQQLPGAQASKGGRR
ncbi:hypothetical protein [Kribbella sp. NPDC048915]|uniref:hypothetical protein n=1 Tax=Kribbella sp. NPDC048915 TaxID=3155148 RepID=UPI0033CD1558